MENKDFEINNNEQNVNENMEQAVFAPNSTVTEDLSKQDTQPIQVNAYQQDQEKAPEYTAPAQNTQPQPQSQTQAQYQQYPYYHQYQNSQQAQQAQKPQQGYQSNTYQSPNYQNAYQRPYGNNVPYNVMNNNTAQSKPAKKAKKSGSGKTVGLIAGTLALALCVGVGGGVLGSYLAGGNSITAETSASESSSAKSESSKSNSSLVINKAEQTSTQLTSTQEVAAKVKDAVVEITTEVTQYDAFYGQYVSQAAGSGVIISEDGYILTNNHVIEDATEITVTLTNSKTYKAKLIGKDATLDVALIKIEEKGLTTATFGDSSKLSVGQTAIAIGNPLGRLGGTVTDGIISALDREIKIDGKTMNLLQTNAAINPGNSGGGLFDANGNLIGLVVAKSSSTSSGTAVEGLGFAIPVNDIVDILDDLKDVGYVTGRGSLGVNVVTVSGENAMFMYRVDKEGVYISAVTAGGAAEKAGLQVGDLIVEFNGKSISQGSDLTSAVSKLKAGTKVEVKIERDGKEQTIEVTLGEKAGDSSSESKKTQQDGNNYYYGNGGNGFFGIN